MTILSRKLAVATTLFLATEMSCAPAFAQAQAAYSDGTQTQKTGDAPPAYFARSPDSVQPASTSGDTSPDVLSNTPSGTVTSAAEDQQGNRARSAATGTAQDENARSGDSASSTHPLHPPSEFEKYVSDLAARPLRRFGSDLVVPGARGFTSPPNTAIPADYHVNAGDQIVIDLTGSVQAVGLHLVVDKQGQIFVPKVGTITVAGVPYAQLQSLISGRVSRQYRNFNLTVSLGELRGITVYVTGFVLNPGSYTVSSLSTLVNAVLAAGGPAPSGSFRSIQVRRGGRLVADFDLYDFLLKGDDSGNITLQNGDVVFMAPAGAQVAAIGSVNREAIYEARSHDTLTDILKYAGGADTVADLSRVHVLDPQAPDGWQQLTPALADQTPARRGMVVRVLSGVGIDQPRHNLQSLVTISGEVNKPGRYFVPPGTSLDKIVEMAGGLTSDAYPFGSVFVRDSLRREQQTNYAKVIEQFQDSLLAQPLVRANSSGQSGDGESRLAILNNLIGQMRRHHVDGRLVLMLAPDATRVPGEFVVQNNDELYIPGTKLDVAVFGMVNSSADFRYAPGRQVREYVALAGGYSRYADKRHVYIQHANGMLSSGSAALKARVLPGDLIFVPVNPDQGLFWSHVRDLTGVLFGGVVAAVAVKSLS